MDVHAGRGVAVREYPLKWKKGAPTDVGPRTPFFGEGETPAIDLGDDVRRGPVDIVDESGRVVRTIGGGDASRLLPWTG